MTLAPRRVAPALLLLLCLGSSALAAGAGTPVRAVFDLSGAGGTFDLPFPNDLRLDAAGHPDLTGFPNPKGLPLSTELQQLAGESIGWTLSQPLYVRFDGALNPAALSQEPFSYADPRAAIQLVDIDPRSSERGRRFPLLVSFRTRADSYRPANLLQALPVQGLELRESTTYAFVVTRAVLAAPGAALESDPALTAVLAGVDPGGALGARAVEVYAPLADFLSAQGIAADELAAAAVFTTGAPTKPLFAVAEKVAARPAPKPLGPLSLLHDFPKYYVLEGTWVVPIFQQGIAPYLPPLFGGIFQTDAQGEPLTQALRLAKFVVTIPKGVMPAAGFPLLFYVNGTGGVHTQVFDRGERDAQGGIDADGGPAEVAAERGWAASGMAAHLQPEHVGPLSLDGYVLYNLFNLRALRDNFFQLVSEQVLFRRLVTSLAIDPALCPATDASASGDGKIRVDPGLQVVMGQSLGSYLSGMLAALDPLGFQGAILTGAGGGWLEFARGPVDPFPLQIVLELAFFQLPLGERLDPWHPLFVEIELALAASNNLHYLRTVLREPRPGRLAPHVLVIQGSFDPQVPDNLQRAQTLALGVDFVGLEVGPFPHGQILPDLLAAGRAQLVPPVAENLVVPGLGLRTAAVVRYLEDGIQDGHFVTFQREEAKHQYGCFLETLASSSTAVIVPGVVQGAPCGN